MSSYAGLTREELISRLKAYESSSQPAASTSVSTSTSGAASAEPPSTRPSKADKGYVFGRHATRHVALLVCYQGWGYSGLAIQPTVSAPTIEGELLKALEKVRLVEAGKGWEGCGFSRCGRTDRGVSGHGQVVNLWLRSSRKQGDGGCDLGDSWRPPAEPAPAAVAPSDGDAAAAGSAELSGTTLAPAKAKAKAKAKEVAPKEPDEFHYTRVLNAVLPPAIRILAWSPAPPTFNSRFSCVRRHYKYHFHRRPTPTAELLDLDLMRAAAADLLGEHDFRNFCKLDGSKQIANHSRRVLEAYFDENADGTVTFNLVGTAFLWHQVRHIIAALFLIGSKLEPTRLVADLLDTTKLPGKPLYSMGHPLPLTLHDCAYALDAGLDWRYGPYDGPWRTLTGEAREAVRERAESGREALERELEAARQEAEVRAWHVGGAMRKMGEIHGEPIALSSVGICTYVGAGELITSRKYVPVVARPMGDAPDEVNRKWREHRAKRDAAAATAVEKERGWAGEPQQAE